MLLDFFSLFIMCLGTFRTMFHGVFNFGISRGSLTYYGLLNHDLFGAILL